VSLSLRDALSGVGVEARVYVLMFVAIMFSGSRFGFAAPYLILVLLALAAWMTVSMPSKKQATALVNKRYLVLPALLVAFSIFLLWQAAYALAPSITETYARRFLIFAAMLVFIPVPAVAVGAVKAAKSYSGLVAASIIGATTLTGVKSGGLVGDFQFGGMMMSVACLLFLVDYFVDGARNTDALGFSLALVGLFISGKRAFAVLVALGFVILFLLTRYRAGSTRAARLAAAGLLVVAPLYAFVPAVRELVARVQLLALDPFTATSGRNVLWAAASDLFRSNPLTGIGFGNFPVYIGANYGTSQMGQYLTHNIYYGLLAETGVVGLSLVLAVMLLGIGQTVRELQRARCRGNDEHYYVVMTALVLQVWFALYGLTGNGIYGWHETFIYMGALGMMLSVRLDSSRIIRYRSGTRGVS